MKAIILAAGMGSRVGKHTEDKPKYLLEVRGKPLIDYQFEALIECGVKDIIVVIGYKGELIRKHILSNPKFKELKVNFVENENYNSTGTAYSWWLAREHIRNEDFVIHLHSDLLFFPELIKGLLGDFRKDIMCVDKKIKLDESYAQTIMDERGKMLILDRRNIPNADGKVVMGVSKFSNSTINRLIRDIENCINQGDRKQALYQIMQKTVGEVEYYGFDISDYFLKEVNTIEDY